MEASEPKSILYVPSPAVLEPDLHLPGPQRELASQGFLLLLQEKKVAFSNNIKFLFIAQLAQASALLHVAMSGRKLIGVTRLLLVKPTVASINCFYY
jgi:hypothetical protein